MSWTWPRGVAAQYSVKVSGATLIGVSGVAGSPVASTTLSNEVNMASRNTMMLGVLVMGAIGLSGCADLVVHDTASLLAPRFQRSEIVGLVAGAGTTFAALPDLIAMLRRRSSKGMNPRMASNMGVFQLAWIYYGLLIASRPVVGWNVIAVVINFLSVAAYARFARRERNTA